jgi:tetratricopeptide (TPR) repeat protein
MPRFIQILFAGALLLLAPAAESFELDRALCRTFLTNNAEYFSHYSMPAEQKVEYALACAGAALETRNQAQATAFLNIAENLAHQNGLTNDEGRAYFASAILADMSEDLPSALHAIAKAVTLFRAAANLDALRQALLFKANLLHRRGRYADSLDIYTELLALANDPGADLLKGECFSEIALLKYKMGQTNDVARLALQALQLFQTNHNAKGEADCLKILGNQASADNPEQAMHFYEQAAAKYKDAGDVHGQANCLFNMGLSLLGQKAYDKAVSSLQDAVEAYTRSASVTGVGIANTALGRTYFLMGSFSKSEAALEQAISLLKKSQDLCRLAEAESDLADLKNAQSDNSAAIIHRNTAIRLYEESGLKDKAAQERKRLQKMPSPP